MANIVILGGNRGIGYFLAERLLEQGNTITILDLYTDGGDALQKRFPDTVLPVVADARKLSGIEKGVTQAMERFGALRLAKTVLPVMRKQKRGRIIFTSSGVGVTGFANISPYSASKGAIEALAKCLKLENAEYGISFHLFHPPLTDTASASGLPIPKEFKADARTVGYGLADHIWSGRFIICHSVSQALQIHLAYHHPLLIGNMMTKMTQRAISSEIED